MKIAVVGLGKIGLPLAVQFASRGHEVVGADVDDRRRREPSTRAAPPFPGEAELDVTARRGRGSGAARGDDGHGVRGRRERRGRRRRAALRRRRRARPTSRLDGRGHRRIGRGPAARAPWSTYETTLPVGTTRNRLAAALEQRLRPARRAATSSSSSARSVSSPAGSSPTCARYPKLVGGVDPEGARRAVAFYERGPRLRRAPRPARPNGVWDLGSAEAAEMAKLAETTYRDVNIGLANQFARFADSVGIDVTQVIEACNTQPYSHIHQPGHRRRRPLHPRLPAAVPVGRPGGDGRARCPRGERGHAGARGARLATPTVT